MKFVPATAEAALHKEIVSLGTVGMSLRSPTSRECKLCGPSQKNAAQARECEERANRANDPMLKKAWLDLARQFREVADR
jgi:hypothetical protein